MIEQAYELYEVIVRSPLIPDEKPSLYGPKRLAIKMPDVPIVIWIDELAKTKWVARFPNYQIKQAFAKAKDKDSIIQELRARWRTVGALKPRGERPMDAEAKGDNGVAIEEN